MFLIKHTVVKNKRYPLEKSTKELERESVIKRAYNQTKKVAKKSTFSTLGIPLTILWEDRWPSYVLLRVLFSTEDPWLHKVMPCLLSVKKELLFCLMCELNNLLIKSGHFLTTTDHHPFWVQKFIYNSWRKKSHYESEEEEEHCFLSTAGTLCMIARVWKIDPWGAAESTNIRGFDSFGVKIPRVFITKHFTLAVLEVEKQLE